MKFIYLEDVLYLHNMPANGHSRIYNMLGSLVYDAIGNTIDVSFLPAGLYNLYTGYENIRFVKE